MPKCHIFFATSTFLHCSSFHGSLKTPSGMDIPPKVSAPFVHLVRILFKKSVDTYNLFMSGMFVSKCATLSKSVSVPIQWSGVLDWTT